VGVTSALDDERLLFDRDIDVDFSRRLTLSGCSLGCDTPRLADLCCVRRTTDAVAGVREGVLLLLPVVEGVPPNLNENSASLSSRTLF